MSYEEGTTIHRSTIELLDKLDKYLKQRDQYKAERDTLVEENTKLKTQKIALSRSYKQILEENKQLQEQLEIYKKGYEKMHEGWFKYRELKTYIFSLADRKFFNRKYIELLEYINELDEEK